MPSSWLDRYQRRPTVADLMSRVRSFLARDRAPLTDAALMRRTLKIQQRQARVVRQLDREVDVLRRRVDNHIEHGHH